VKTEILKSSQKVNNLSGGDPLEAENGQSQHLYVKAPTYDLISQQVFRLSESEAIRLIKKKIPFDVYLMMKNRVIKT